MAKLGDPVVFTVPDNHLTVTRKGDVELTGSIYHPAQSTFAAIVAGELPGDGADEPYVPKYHLALLVPGSDKLKWAIAPEGDRPGSFRTTGDLADG